MEVGKFTIGVITVGEITYTQFAYLEKWLGAAFFIYNSFDRSFSLLD